ncbi:hypothetical protein GCM10011450_13530 [Advenella faeciporci]|uniref:FmdB family transcriptional regulator n=1 Tax=Advenella faeciporci TaxID=797535 RepID=A0A918MY76_9BURK|nr:hypothetical protein GCM10011450_13530 [Advenella faeciporci]
MLQKMSDEPLTVCPECNQETYAKQVTAAGFQLKGTGWYVTDFRGGSASSGDASASAGSSSTSAGSTASTSGSSSTSA